jgi:release factor glutamine methyltransferase
MLISEYIKINAPSLVSTNRIDERESQTLLRFLIEDSLQINRIDFSTYSLNKEEMDLLNQSLERLKKNEPLQYITGKAYFYGLEFEVSPAVLIPRPETEELVDWLIENHKNKNNLKILDIGTGSGCIAISLAKNLPNAEVSAIDISAEALNIARNNAILNHVKVDFINADILTLQILDQNYDVIVSNPPYVRELEKEQMQQNVLSNEPHIALFVANGNPLVFYDKIAELAKNHLTENGVLYFEINQYLGAETVDLLKTKGFNNIKVKKDIYDVDRMVKCLL